MMEHDLGAEFYEAYEEHSKVLRTWLVAYGIGAPVVLLTNETAATKLVMSGGFGAAGTLFLVGVAAQVSLAALNKTVMWACYFAERHPEVKTHKRFRAAYWISEQFLIDFVVDVVTMALFAWATWMLFGVLVPTTSASK
jgi:uncharacterized protein YaaQ